jgi:hypothetical protein
MAEDQTPKHSDVEDLEKTLVIKAIGEQTAMLSNLAYANLINNVNLAQQNAVANQQAMNQIQVAVTGKVINLLTNLSPMEAAAVVKLDTGNDLAEQLADLKAALAAFSSSSTPESENKGAGQ